MLLALPLEKLQLLMASDAPKLEPIAVGLEYLKSRSPYAAGRSKNGDSTWAAHALVPHELDKVTDWLWTSKSCMIRPKRSSRGSGHRK
jgi:hypothetical protein